MKLEKCKHCGEELSICSRGAVNCFNCGQYIRPLNEEEFNEWSKKRDELFEELIKENQNILNTEETRFRQPGFD